MGQPWFKKHISSSAGYSPQGPATRRTARGLERPRTDATALTQAGGVRISLGSVGRRGKPHGSTRIRCLTLHKRMKKEKNTLHSLGGVIALKSTGKERTMGTDYWNAPSKAKS